MTSTLRVAVVDYGMGNRRSVQKALQRVGARAEITRDPRDLNDADGIVVPGVGAFPLAMRRLGELKLAPLLRDHAAAGKPLLGICLGMQLLFDSSEELEPATGLGLIHGQVTALATGGLRVPHIGWNVVTFHRPSPLTEPVAGPGVNGRPFYHVHSFAVRPSDPEVVIASTEYGERFATVVQQRNVCGVQFHPEKSSGDGLSLLAGFLRLCAGSDRDGIKVAA